MNENPEDTAWKIHSALIDWTGKVDTKASFALTVDSAILVTITALSGNGRRLGRIDGFAIWVFHSGIALLALGALLAVAVVVPNLRKEKMTIESPQNFLFFGHIRHWDADDLEMALRERDPLPVLSRQLTVMSKIAWAKHERVKKSFASGVLGALLIAVAGIFG